VFQTALKFSKELVDKSHN